MIPKCRDCKYWVDMRPWQGNCKLTPAGKPQWSESATPVSRGLNCYTPRVQPGTYRDGRLVQPI